MDIDLNDLNAFLAVARAKGFRDGARASGSSASGLSESVRRLETTRTRVERGAGSARPSELSS
jgi:DNA-binding transcriptional LysR family regulator